MRQVNKHSLKDTGRIINFSIESMFRILLVCIISFMCILMPTAVDRSNNGLNIVILGLNIFPYILLDNYIKLLDMYIYLGGSRKKYFKNYMILNMLKWLIFSIITSSFILYFVEYKTFNYFSFIIKKDLKGFIGLFSLNFLAPIAIGLFIKFISIFFNWFKKIHEKIANNIWIIIWIVIFWGDEIFDINIKINFSLIQVIIFFFIISILLYYLNFKALLKHEI